MVAPDTQQPSSCMMLLERLHSESPLGCVCDEMISVNSSGKVDYAEDERKANDNHQRKFEKRTPLLLAFECSMFGYCRPYSH